MKKMIANIDSNQIQKFPHNVFGELQVIEQNGEFYFIARGVAKILGYADKSNMTKMIKMMTNILNKDEKMLVNLELSDRTRKRIIISESGLYRLINNSSNSNAKEFKKWIISEVLPEMFNTYFHSSGADIESVINVSEMAAIITQQCGIQVSNQKLFAWLIYYNLCIKYDTYNIPTQLPEGLGLMKSKPNRANNNKLIKTTLITAKGEKYILDRFLKEQKAA